MKINKAIIPVAGLGTRFLPLSKTVPKELWPLVDKPVLQYIVEEAVASGIKEIIFVNSPGKKSVNDYFKKSSKSKKSSSSKYKNQFLKELEGLENISKNISFSQVFQKEALGDGHAVLMAKKLVKNQPCAVLFSDDIVESKTPCLKQMIGIFQEYRRPIIALCPVPKERVSSYGIVKTARIGRGAHEIKGIKEKPSLSSAPSRLAIVGKYIITPEVFDYLEKFPLAAGEIRLAGAFSQMINDGKKVLGYEFKGKWLECGDKLNYLKSNLYLSLKHPRFGRDLNKFLKKI